MSVSEKITDQPGIKPSQTDYRIEGGNQPRVKGANVIFFTSSVKWLYLSLSPI